MHCFAVHKCRKLGDKQLIVIQLKSWREPVPHVSCTCRMTTDIIASGLIIPSSTISVHYGFLCVIIHVCLAITVEPFTQLALSACIVTGFIFCTLSTYFTGFSPFSFLQVLLYMIASNLFVLSIYTLHTRRLSREL